MSDETLKLWVPLIASGIAFLASITNIVVTGIFSNRNSRIAEEALKINKQSMEINDETKEINRKNQQINYGTLQLKQYEDEKKEIYRQIASFYNPLRQLRGASNLLSQELRRNRPSDFRTLIALLQGEKFVGNDEILLNEILTIGKQTDDLIMSQGGCVNDLELLALLQKASVHFRLMRLASAGSLTFDTKFEKYVFPNELDDLLQKHIQSKLDRLDALDVLHQKTGEKIKNIYANSQETG